MFRDITGSLNLLTAQTKKRNSANENLRLDFDPLNVADNPTRGERLPRDNQPPG